MSERRQSWLWRLASRCVDENVRRLFLGGSLAQVVTIAASPILTRLYTPGDLGLLASLMSATTILAPLVTLRFEMGLALATSREEAAAVASLAASTATLMSIGLAALALSLPVAWARHLGPLAPYWWSLALSLFGNAIYAISVYEATRIGGYEEIARSRVAQAVITATVTIALGVMGVHHYGVLAGFLLGVGVGPVLVIRSLLATGQSTLAGITLGSIRSAAAKFRNFAQYSSWSEIVDLAGGQFSSIIVLTAIYGPDVGGYLFLADRVIGRPLMLVSTSILQVYVGEIGALFHADRAAILHRFLKASISQMVVSGGWLVTIVLLSKFIVVPLFGEKWAATVTYMQIIALGYFPATVVHSVFHTLTIIGKQRIYAIWSVIRVVVMIGVYVYCVRAGLSPIQAVALVTVTQALGDVFRYGVTFRFVRRLQ